MYIKTIWYVFFITKICYLLFGHFVYAKISTLGDSTRYLNASIEINLSTFTNSTYMMDFFGGITGKIFGDILGSLPFCIFNFICTYKCVSKFNLNKNNVILVLILLSFPSYGMWTSVASKEAIVSSIVFLITHQFFKITKNKKVNIPILCLAYYFMLVFKVQYVPILFLLHIFLLIYYRYKYIYTAYLLYVPFLIILSCSFTYYYRDLIDQMAFLVATHFNPDASSTRNNFLLIKKYDFFYNAPYGIFIGTFGPTIAEASTKITHLISFIESTLIILSLAIIYIYKKFISIFKNKLYVNDVTIPLITLFLFCVVQYPFGIMNPGSAIRYRCSFYPIVILSFFLYNNYKNIISVKSN